MTISRFMQWTWVVVVVFGCAVKPVDSSGHFAVDFQANFVPEEKKLCGSVFFDGSCTVSDGDSDCDDATLKINGNRTINSSELHCDFETGVGGVVLTDDELAQSPITLRLTGMRAAPNYYQDYTMAVPSHVRIHKRFEARDVRLGNYLSSRSVNVLAIQDNTLKLLDLDGTEVWSSEECCEADALLAAELETTTSTGVRSIVLVEDMRIMLLEADSGRLVTEYTLSDEVGNPLGIQAGYIGTRPAVRLMFANGPKQIYLDTGTTGYASAILTPRPTDIRYSTRFGRGAGVAQYELADNSLVHEALEGLLQLSGVETSDGDLFLCDYETCVSQDDISVVGPYVGRLKRAVDDIESASGFAAPEMLAWPSAQFARIGEVFAFPWSPTNQVEDQDGFDTVVVSNMRVAIYRSEISVLSMDLRGASLSALVSAEPNEARLRMYLALDSSMMDNSTKAIRVLSMQAPVEPPLSSPFRLYSMGTPGNLFYFVPLSRYH